MIAIAARSPSACTSDTVSAGTSTARRQPPTIAPNGSPAARSGTPNAVRIPSATCTGNSAAGNAGLSGKPAMITGSFDATTRPAVPLPTGKIADRQASAIAPSVARQTVVPFASTVATAAKSASAIARARRASRRSCSSVSSAPTTSLIAAISCCCCCCSWLPPRSRGVAGRSAAGVAEDAVVAGAGAGAAAVAAAGERWASSAA